MKQRGGLQILYLLFVSSFLLFLIAQEFSHENSLIRLESSTSASRSSFREKSFFFAAAAPISTENDDTEESDEEEDEQVQNYEEEQSDEEEQVNTLSLQDAENLEQEGEHLEDTAATLFFDTLGEDVKHWFGRIINWKTSSNSNSEDPTFHRVITPAINTEPNPATPVTPIASHGTPRDPWLDKQVAPKEEEEESSSIRSFIHDQDPEWALVPELPRFVHRAIYRLTKLDRNLYFGTDLKFLDGLKDKLERCTNVNDLVKAVSEARKISKKEAEDMIRNAATAISKTEVAKRLEDIERKIHMWNQLRKNTPKTAPQLVDLTPLSNATLSALDPFHGKVPTPDQIIEHLYKEGKLTLQDSAEKVRRVRNLIMHVRQAHGLQIQATKLNKKLTAQQKLIVRQAMKGIRKELRKLAGLKKQKERLSPEDKAVLRLNSMIALLKEFQLHSTVAKKQVAEKLIENLFWLKHNFNILAKEKGFKKRLLASEKMAVSLDSAIHRRWNRVKTHVVFGRITIRTYRVWKHLARFLTQMKKFTPGMASVDLMMRQVPKLADVIDATKKSMDKEQKPEFLDLLVQQVSNSVTSLKHAAEQESATHLDQLWTETTKNYELFLIKYRIQLIDWLLKVRDAIVSSCIAPVPPPMPQPVPPPAVPRRTPVVPPTGVPQVSVKPVPVPTIKPITTVKPAPVPTVKPVPVPTVKPVPVPTVKPAPVPTMRPVPVPTVKPVPVPTVKPVPVPTMRPVPVPTVKPVPVPTVRPPVPVVSRPIPPVPVSTIPKVLPQLPISVFDGPKMGAAVLANTPEYKHLVPRKRQNATSTSSTKPSKLYDFYGVKPLNVRTATYDQMKEHGILVAAGLKKLIKSKFFPNQKKSEKQYYAQRLPLATMSVIQCQPSNKKHVLPSEFRDLYKAFKTLRRAHTKRAAKLTKAQKRQAKRFVKFNKMLKETAWGMQTSATCKQLRKSMKQMHKRLFKVYKGYVSKKHHKQFQSFLRKMRHISFERKNGLKHKKHTAQAKSQLKKVLGKKNELVRLLYSYSYHAFKATLDGDPVEFLKPPKKVRKGKKSTKQNK